MIKPYINFDKEGPFIDVCYKIENEVFDNFFLKKVVDIVGTKNLQCKFGKDNIGKRYFHITGTNLEELQKAEEELEKLNIENSGD